MAKKKASKKDDGDVLKERLVKVPKGKQCSYRSKLPMRSEFYPADGKFSYSEKEGIYKVEGADKAYVELNKSLFEKHFQVR